MFLGEMDLVDSKGTEWLETEKLSVLYRFVSLCHLSKYTY